MSFFKIKFNSVHFPLNNNMTTNINISEESLSLLTSLYDSIYKAVASAKIFETVEKTLDKSIFGCCIPEGYAMLKCEIKANMTAELHGFIIRKDESLRTAWKIARWQLLLLCAKGWMETRVVEMTLDKINEETASLNFDLKYQKAILKVGQNIMMSDIPYNFALTAFSLRKLALDFSENSVTMETEDINGESESSIVLDKRFEENYFRQYSDETIGIDEMCLILLSTKDYINVAERMCYEDNTREAKANAKNEVSVYNSDYVWCFKLKVPDGVYYELINMDMHRKLMDSIVDYSEICVNFNAFMRNAKAYFERKNQYTEKQEEARLAEEEQKKSKPKEKKGFAAFLHRRKSDD